MITYSAKETRQQKGQGGLHKRKEVKQRRFGQNLKKRGVKQSKGQNMAKQLNSENSWFKNVY